MSTECETLAQRMIALADAGDPAADDLREAAWALDKAALAYTRALGRDGTTESLLQRWAIARRLWCERTGEDLI
jgi:hypothetical protein